MLLYVIFVCIALLLPFFLGFCLSVLLLLFFAFVFFLVYFLALVIIGGFVFWFGCSLLPFFFFITKKYFFKKIICVFYFNNFILSYFIFLFLFFFFFSTFYSEPCGRQALGAPARFQGCASEVGEPSSGHWSTRDLTAPHDIKRQKSPRDLHLKAKTQLH